MGGRCEGRHRPTDMKRNTPEDESLSKLLGHWEVSGAPTPRFQERVWSRIEQAERVSTLSLWERLCDRVTEALARPAVAAAYVVTLLVGGFAVGHVKSDADQARIQKELTARYVQSVDPYAQVAE